MKHLQPATWPLCVFLLGVLTASTGAAEPTITSVTPSSPRVGDLLVISGSQFGTAPGRDGPRWVSLAPTPHSRGGNFQGASPAIPVPIAQWRDDRILVVMQGVPPGDYRLAIRDSNSRDGANARESNAVVVVVQPWQPVVPAVRADAAGRGAINTSKVIRVHPDIAFRGQTLDVYGDFPFPDPSIDEVLVRPVGPSWAADHPPMFHTLRPASIFKNHLTVRLPENGYPAGLWAVTVRKRGGPEGTAGRFVMRVTEPASWEHSSALRGSRSVSYRLVGAVANVGLEGRYVDVLGYGFGPQGQGSSVNFLDDTELAGVISNLRTQDNDDALIMPLPAKADILSWSDTRLRVSAPRTATGNVTPGTFHVILSSNRDRRWSNSVTVRIP